MTARESLLEVYNTSVNLLLKAPLYCIRKLTMKVFLKQCGKKASFGRKIEVRKPYRIQIGDNSSINKRVLLDARGGVIIIGKDVDIAQESNIWTLQHDYNSPIFIAKGGDVIIDDYVWIASRVTILPGVHIGKGAVIASGAVVTKDVSPYTVVAGIPARPIAERQRDLHYHPSRPTIF